MQQTLLSVQIFSCLHRLPRWSHGTTWKLSKLDLFDLSVPDSDSHGLLVYFRHRKSGIYSQCSSEISFRDEIRSREDMGLLKDVLAAARYTLMEAYHSSDVQLWKFHFDIRSIQ